LCGIEPVPDTFYHIRQFFRFYSNDGFVKSRFPLLSVIPAKAGIQCFQEVLDTGFRRRDSVGDFL